MPWILAQPTAVDLGAHVFDHTRRPEAVVARAGPADVKLQDRGRSPGATDVRGRLGSLDLAARRPEPATARLATGETLHVSPRSLPLPFFSPDTDFAVGPAGALYDARWDAAAQLLRLDRLSPTGKVLWESTLAADISNSPLRVGPNGALDAVAGLPGALGSERGWTPITTRAGTPLSVAQQKRLAGWPFQPAPGPRPALSVGHTITARDALRPDRPRQSRRPFLACDEPYSDRAGLQRPSYGRRRPGGGARRDRGVGGAGHLSMGVRGAEARTRGTAGRYSLARTVWGDNLLADVRVGPGRQALPPGLVSGDRRDRRPLLASSMSFRG